MNWFQKTLLRMAGQKIEHVDKVRPLETWRAYGGQEVVPRDPEALVDLLAPYYNANVYVAIRAIIEAVRKLDVRIVRTETVNGKETKVPDPDHPANQVLQNPNTEMTFRELVCHNIWCYLADGNAIATIERMTGPNGRIEIWPRDPRHVERLIANGKPGMYKFSVAAFGKSMLYRPEQILHIREMNPANPFWGRPRHQAVRDEIYSDHCINTYNKELIIHGGGIGLMFTPASELSEVQHNSILAALKNEVGDIASKFKWFINRYPGTFTMAAADKKDMSFLELLKHNREKIYSAFGLPPFRGGVMEYANYANALAQDKDFWLNTIQPVTAFVEDGYDRQVFHRFFDEQIGLEFNYGEVPALKGEPEEVARVHQIYVQAGVLTPDEVRKELSLPPLPKSEKPQEPGDENPPEDENPNATPEEEQSLSDAIHAVFRQQDRRVVKALEDYTVNGRMMSKLMLPKKVADLIFNRVNELSAMSAAGMPIIRDSLRRQCIECLRGTGRHVKMDDVGPVAAFKSLRLTMADVNNETFEQLIDIIGDADKYRWDLPRTNKAIHKVFTLDRARATARLLLADLTGHSRMIVKAERDADFLERKCANV